MHNQRVQKINRYPHAFGVGNCWLANYFKYFNTEFRYRYFRVGGIITGTGIFISSTNISVTTKLYNPKIANIFLHNSSQLVQHEEVMPVANSIYLYM